MFFYCSNSKKVSIFAVEIVTDVTVTPVTITVTPVTIILLVNLATCYW